MKNHKNNSIINDLFTVEFTLFTFMTLKFADDNLKEEHARG